MPIQAIEVKKPSDAYEAIACLIGGMLYFFTTGSTKAKATGWIGGGSLAVLMLKFLVLPAVDNYITDRIEIVRSQPIKVAPSAGGDSLHTEIPAVEALAFGSIAMAGESLGGGVAMGDSILIDGAFYGMADPRYAVWKRIDSDALFIYDREMKIGFDGYVKGIDVRLMQKAK